MRTSEPAVNIPGHLAVALVQQLVIVSRYRPEKRVCVTRALLAASLFPDVVDKTLGYVFKVMPGGRHYAHNIFSLVGFSTAVSLLWGKSAGSAWFVGYLGHLWVDSNRQIPWWFPLAKYDFKHAQFRVDRAQILKESMFLGLVFLIRRLSRS